MFLTSKILYCATVDYHFKAFHLPEMEWFKQQGWEVHVAAAGDMTLPFTDKKFSIAIHRSPFHKDNLKGYRQLRDIIREHQYTLIHAHTPLGGVLGRLAGKEARKTGTQMIYTAHGFHFCKDVSVKNWALYYPIERLLARYTDRLLTINEEDFQLAVRHKFKAGHIQKVNGVGVDTERFQPLPEAVRMSRKKSLGFNGGDRLLFNASEFNRNKNQQALLMMMAELKQTHPEVKLLLAGEGKTLADCQQLAQDLELDDAVRFLGFQTHIENLLLLCDVAVAASLREGLPVNIMEAMSCELPVIATSNRGHRELIQPHRQGYLLDTATPAASFAAHVGHLLDHEPLRQQYGQSARRKIQHHYSVGQVMTIKSQLYQDMIKETSVTSDIG